ncbi:helix-turn-helix domain-containing protein [Corynebacterium confusum]
MENRTRNKPGKPAGDNPQLLHLGEYLAGCRRERGILQQKLAEDAGVSRSTLHAIEHGGTGVRWEKVAAVAQALGLELTFKDQSE